MTSIMPSTTIRRRAFRKLHESGCFILPNPWDIGSARYLQSLGFKALASTSSGLAWSKGRRDNGLTRDQVLEHLRELVEATDLPVNADFENGFATDANAIGESVRLAVETGIAGLSIEDSTGEADVPLFELADAAARIRAARKAVDASGGDTLLVARAECFVVGRPDLAETLARLKAYAEAGADCLYAPGVRTAEQIGAIVAAVHPKPVNVLMGGSGDLTFDQVAALGVRRVSIGGGLACAAWGGFTRAARLLADHNSFEGFVDVPSHSEIDAFF